MFYRYLLLFILVSYFYWFFFKGSKRRFVCIFLVSGEREYIYMDPSFPRKPSHTTDNIEFPQIIQIVPPPVHKVISALHSCWQNSLQRIEGQMLRL